MNFLVIGAISGFLVVILVSKLLGHASVTTTERHYAPLLATDVEEFVL